MTAKKSTTISILFLAFTFLLGCGSSLPSTVHASAPALPDVGPDSIHCGPTDDGTACSFITHVKDAQGNVLFYCQGETHVFDATKTMSFGVEIGVSSLISDPNLSGCSVPMPERTNLLNMRGNLSLTPFTGNLTSIVTWIYAMDSGHKGSLYTGKIQATKGIATAIPFEGSSGQPLVFPSGHYADNFLVWFNIDLPDSVPATISAAGSGDIE
jgi:hypothetical protein